ncbi:MAG: DUF58 domain-containing protein [Pseudomonadota bacterium]
MIPSRKLLLATAALIPLAAVAWLLPAVSAWWQPAAVLLVGVGLVDGFLASRTPVPAVERQVPASLALGQPAEVRLTITLQESAAAVEVRVYDHYPELAEVRNMPSGGLLSPEQPLTLSYAIRPKRRGLLEFPQCDLRLQSPLGLWWRQLTVNESTYVRCYPNFSTISQLLEFEATSNTATSGLRLSRRRGEGIEFDQLRDYRVGDPMRSIDWKATARVQRLISREYQDERDQQVLILLDTGRRMLARDGEWSHFDHALNAALLLTYVALRQGDAVGIVTIGDGRPWLPPRKGADAVNSVLNHIYDIEPKPVEIDFSEAAQRVATLQKRRALVVLLSNVRDADADDLQQAIGLLQRRHLVMLASLREAILDQTVEAPVADFDDALQYAATERYLEARRSTQQIVASNGVSVDDCLPAQLAATVANRYLSIKRAGRL